MGTAAEVFALTTPKVSMVLWEKDVLGQFCSCGKLDVDCCSAHVQSLVWQSGIWFLKLAGSGVTLVWGIQRG